MLQKSQIFYFLLSFIITFTVGFFVWNIFVNSDNILNQVLSQANQLGSKIFTASLSTDYQDEAVVSPVDLEKPEAATQNLAPEVNLADFVDNANQNTIIVAQESVQDQLDDIQEKLDIISQ